MPALLRSGEHHSTRQRRRAGAGLLTLSTATSLAVASEYLASGQAATWLANAGWTGAALAAVIGLAGATRGGDRRDGRGWATLLFASASWLLGQLLWTVYSATAFPGSPNAADACWLAFAVLAAAGVHRLGLGAQGSRRVSWLEIAPVIVAICALITAVLWSDIRASSLSPAGRLTSLAYPVLYVSAAMVMIQSVLSGALEVRRNPGMAAVLGGLMVEALAFILWSPQLLAGTYVAGTNAVDALWSLGLILVAGGAWATRPAVAVVDVDEISRRRGGVLPSLTFVVLTAFQVAFLADGASTAADLVLTVGVSVVGMALIVRASVLRRQQTVLLSDLHAREQELRQANGRLSDESRRDALTGVGNRLRLREDLAELRAQSRRRDGGYCMVLCDLDRFKDYNDAFGHQAGDRALQEVAALLCEHTRDGDRVYRYGGEELLLLLPEQDLTAGRAAAERHRSNLEQLALPHPSNPPAGIVTLSAGIAAAQPGETPDDVLRRADAALYRAKRSGRNRTAAANPENTSRDREPVN
jgi:diguanylate cyclase (GGDEF)-like protein